MKVKLDNKDIEVTKLPLGRYSEFLEIFHTLPSKLNLSSLADMKTQDILRMLPEIILNNIPEAQKIIMVGTGLPKEEVEALGMNESIDLLMAIFEVNQYKEVYEKIKKGIARLPKISTKTQAGLPSQSTP